jgi:hypothetical protein
MYSPLERQVVNGVGLGELDGMFNIGKMFTRMFTFTPSSFKLKNIAGAIGSAVTTTATFGMANVASEIAGPSGLKLTKGTLTGAHSKPMQFVGYGTMAAAAAAGAYFGGSALLSAGAGTAGATGTGLATTAGTAAQGTGIGVASTTATAGGGFFSTVGTALSNVGSGLMTAMKALPLIGQVLGGGGGAQQQQQQGGMTQAEYDAQVKAQQDAQAAYDTQVRAQQAQLFQPGVAQSMPVSFMPETGQPSMTGMNASYGDLRTPYTAITEDGQQVQVNPATGQIVPEGMSTEMMIGIGGVVALGLGWYFMSDSKSTN